MKENWLTFFIQLLNPIILLLLLNLGMKKTEKKVRNEIFEVLMCHVKIYNNDQWIGHIGGIWVDARVIGGNTIINCYYSSIQFIRLVVSEGLMIKFKAAPIGEGLAQLRWFLEQIKKRDKDRLQLNL